ncbi:MAG: trypsin-like peptidase domain-containing protein [Candidatus Omnitrophota bacterium]
MKRITFLKPIFFMVFTAAFLCIAFSYASDKDLRETPIVKIVQENKDAVVNISTERVVFLRENPAWGNYGSEFDSFFENFFYDYRRPAYAMKLNSVGSGVVIDKKGIVITNAHVVNMASSIYVVLNDGTHIKGQVMYEDPACDLALVKIDPLQELREVKLGTTEDLMIGETVVAIGNPLGLENSVTAGIVSGKDRSLQSKRGDVAFVGLIQTDAPINPGTSGGALLNINSELIGINVAVVQNSQSIGFAIPVEKIKEVISSYDSSRSIAIKHRKDISSSSPQGPNNRAYNRDSYDSSVFSQMRKIQEEMDRIFQSGSSDASSGKGRGMFNTNIFYDPTFDIEDNKDSYLIKLDVTGMDKDKIDIEINENSITVSSKREEIKQSKSKDSLFQSQSQSSFLRTIPLPKDADTKSIQTNIDRNMLVIKILKKT